MAARSWSLGNIQVSVNSLHNSNDMSIRHMMTPQRLGALKTASTAHHGLLDSFLCLFCIQEVINLDLFVLILFVVLKEPAELCSL